MAKTSALPSPATVAKGAPTTVATKLPLGASMASPVQQGVSALRTRWQDWMAQPGNRQALLQFGVTMLQPIQPGQTLGGQVGQAIGSGAQARDRYLGGQAAAAQASQSAANEAAALDIDRQQLEVNRQNAATQTQLASGRAGSREAFIGSILQDMITQYRQPMDLDGVTPIGPSPGEYAQQLANDQELLTAIGQMYDTINGTGQPAAQPQQPQVPGGAPIGAGANTGGDELTFLNAQAARTPPGPNDQTVRSTATGRTYRWNGQQYVPVQ